MATLRGMEHRYAKCRSCGFWVEAKSSIYEEMHRVSRAARRHCNKYGHKVYITTDEFYVKIKGE